MMAVSQKATEFVLSGHNIFLLGQAGTGKTHLIKDLCKKLIAKGRNVQMTATTGVASANFGQGMTIHKFSGVGDGHLSTNALVNNIMHNCDKKDILFRIKNIDVLFIDEISMLSEKLLLQIEELFRRVRQNNSPFGGVQVKIII